MKVSAQPKPAPAPDRPDVLRGLFQVLFGTFLGLSFLKFSNPAIFDRYVDVPVGGYQWALNAWPLKIGYDLLVALTVVGSFAARLRPARPKWLFLLPLAWLGWQFIAATQSVDERLTRLTVMYFVTCGICFYLGYFCLGRSRLGAGFWLPLSIALILVIIAGLDQHFGGLEETRKYFYAYVYPNLEPGTVPPEYLKKMESSRIFSTLFYPNALAGALLLLMPPISLALWQQLRDKMTPAAKSFLLGLLWLGALGCLYWTKSKGGWLLGLALALITLLHLSVPRRLKILVAAALLVMGLAGFALKYAGYFEKGATSVQARFDYWRAAVQTTEARPVFGTGPGTFERAYAAVKRPESEMARLTHNDYLEQASDSGLPGFTTYLAFVVAILWVGYKAPNSAESWARFAVWLGVLSWALQGISEFCLYIPALSWTAFALSGWLAGTNGSDTVK